MNLKNILIAVVFCTIGTWAKAQVEEPPPPVMEEEIMIEEAPVEMAAPMDYAVEAAEPADPSDRIAVKIVINMQGKVTSAKAIPGRSTSTEADILRQAEQRARTLVYEAINTTKADERIVFVRVGETSRNRYRRYH